MNKSKKIKTDDSKKDLATKKDDSKKDLATKKDDSKKDLATKSKGVAATTPAAPTATEPLKSALSPERKSRERTRSSVNQKGKTRSVSPKGSISSTYDDESKVKTFALSRSQSGYTSMTSLGTPIKVRLSSSPYHADCVPDENIDEAIRQEIDNRNQISSKVFDPLDLANEGKSPPTVGTALDPELSEILTARGGKSAFAKKGDTNGDKNGDKNGGINGGINGEGNGGGIKCPCNGPNEDQKNVCIHIHANGDKSEIMIDPEDLQLLIKWKAEKQKHSSLNNTEKAILCDWKKGKVQVKRSHSALRKGRKHRTSQTNENDCNCESWAQSCPINTHSSQQPVIDDCHCNDIPVNPAMDFNADGTFHTPDMGPQQHHQQQQFQPMPNPMFNNTWMKCSPNCCWYSYTNCTHWNPLANGGGNNMMANTNHYYE